MLSNEEKLLKDRIQHLLRMKKCPISWLDESPTMQARLGRQINGEAAVPFTTLQLILERFHDISADWLILGELPMQKSEHVGSRIYNTTNVAQDNQCGGDIHVGSTRTQVLRNREIEERDQIIAQLRAQVEELKRDKQLQQNIIEAFITGQKK